MERRTCVVQKQNVNFFLAYTVHVYHIHALHVPFGLLVSSAYHMTPRWMDGWMDRQTDGRMDVWMDGQTDRRMDGCMDGWMDGWIISEIHNIIMRNSLYMYMYNISTPIIVKTTAELL